MEGENTITSSQFNEEIEAIANLIFEGTGSLSINTGEEFKI